MAENANLPDFVRISEAYQTLADEVPRLENIRVVQQEDRLQQLIRLSEQQQEKAQQQHDQNQQRFDQIQQQLAAISSRLSVIENSNTQIRNAQTHLANPAAVLTPLRNIETGIAIPNCPATINDINSLTDARANSILQALQIPLPARLTLQGKRELVRQQFI